MFSFWGGRKHLHDVFRTEHHRGSDRKLINLNFMPCGNSRYQQLDNKTTDIATFSVGYKFDWLMGNIFNRPVLDIFSRH